MRYYDDEQREAEDRWFREQVEIDEARNAELKAYYESIGAGEARAIYDARHAADQAFADQFGLSAVGDLGVITDPDEAEWPCGTSPYGWDD